MTKSSKSEKSKAADLAFQFMKSPFPLFNPTDIAEAGARNLGFATRAARACLSGAAQMNWEMVDFANKRFQKDLACAQGFVTAGSSQGAYETQASFVQDALRDYAEQTSKLFHLAADIANNAMAPVDEHAKEMLSEVDEQAEKVVEAA